ncbi:alcohol dehydrogenase catalytic domain-containing protein [Microlunatus parietis]|uniref:Threonine dehydrogenase-like Zn-dependent dehydrogenase n=1 Tax=Microlunatus parietis TaxID=682979 RepID=A0A7Y9I4E8_9ACTN|nr:alcohol dehydrogenase catalytic domain-containing protein [Microlunatus parietis]NYE70044.1 threonine dehydrogenase-like Zn-dependent dehydrogenase [Microlunatus parietis]
MRAVTWQGRRKITVAGVPDPVLKDPGDVIISVTATGICGSDLHLYEVLGPYLTPGDILGHEPMGVVEEVGAGVTKLEVGDRVVVPFTIACGSCWMCRQGLQSQCETTQVREYGCGAALFGYSKLYGSVPGGQAERLRVPYADYGPIRIDGSAPDDHYLFLSDILPTAWQAVEYADVDRGGSVAVLGLGPVGQLITRIANHRGLQVFGVDPVPERRVIADRHGVGTLDLSKSVLDELRDRTEGRGPDAVIDAVGMEAHGSPVVKAAHDALGLLPGRLAEPLLDRAGLDRTAALRLAIRAVRRGGTLSLAGVYGGEIDPLPMRELFDKQVQIRMGQCNVRRWTDTLLPLAEDPADPLSLSSLVTHRLPLDEAPAGYEMFQRKDDGCLKIILEP